MLKSFRIPADADDSAMLMHLSTLIAAFPKAQVRAFVRASVFLYFSCREFMSQNFFIAHTPPVESFIALVKNYSYVPSSSTSTDHSVIDARTYFVLVKKKKTKNRCCAACIMMIVFSFFLLLSFF